MYSYPIVIIFKSDLFDISTTNSGQSEPGSNVNDDAL